MISVSLPFPPSGLMPNRANGKHWSSTRALKDKYFNDAYTLTFHAVNRHVGAWYPLDGHIPLSITFVMPDNRDRDLDNLLASIKSGIDGIATALTVNDKAFSPITIKRGDVVKHGAVLVEVGE